ncbi:hypothetical protein Tco_0516124 [Tanacetum coccineum]
MKITPQTALIVSCTQFGGVLQIVSRAKDSHIYGSPHPRCSDISQTMSSSLSLRKGPRPPEEDDDEDPEEDPVDYPADGGDDGDDEEGSLEDDEDDDMDIEADMVGVWRAL